MNTPYLNINNKPHRFQGETTPNKNTDTALTQILDKITLYLTKHPPLFVLLVLTDALDTIDYVTLLFVSNTIRP